MRIKITTGRVLMIFFDESQLFCDKSHTNVFFWIYLEEIKKSVLLRPLGEMAEWSIAAVLKTVEPWGSWGSNPYLSANY